MSCNAAIDSALAKTKLCEVSFFVCSNRCTSSTFLSFKQCSCISVADVQIDSVQDLVTSMGSWTVQDLRANRNIVMSFRALLYRNQLLICDVPARNGGKGEPSYTIKVVFGRGMRALYLENKMLEFGLEIFFVLQE